MTTDERALLDAGVEAWRRADEAAAHAGRLLGRARERARVAALHAEERRRRGEEARASGQRAFAQGLLDAAHAYERTRRAAEEQVGELELRHGQLRAAAEARAVEAQRLAGALAAGPCPLPCAAWRAGDAA